MPIGLGVVITNAAEFVRIKSSGLITGENDRLVATHTRTLFNGMRIQAAVRQIVFGSCDKESAGGMDRVQPIEINVASVHDIMRSGFEFEAIEEKHIMLFSAGKVEKCRYIAGQVERHVEFDRGPLFLESRPRKQIQGQLDRRRINEIDSAVEIEVGGQSVGIELSRFLD